MGSPAGLQGQTRLGPFLVPLFRLPSAQLQTLYWVPSVPGVPVLYADGHLADSQTFKTRVTAQGCSCLF